MPPETVYSLWAHTLWVIDVTLLIFGLKILRKSGMQSNSCCKIPYCESFIRDNMGPVYHSYGCLTGNLTAWKRRSLVKKKYRKSLGVPSFTRRKKRQRSIRERVWRTHSNSGKSRADFLIYPCGSDVPPFSLGLSHPLWLRGHLPLAGGGTPAAAPAKAVQDKFLMPIQIKWRKFLRRMVPPWRFLP